MPIATPISTPTALGIREPGQRVRERRERQRHDDHDQYSQSKRHQLLEYQPGDHEPEREQDSSVDHLWRQL